MKFIEKMKELAKNDIKIIVLPESEDIRILKATEIVLKEQFANIILLGKEKQIKKLASENNIDINGAKIIDPIESNTLKKYVKALYE